MFVNKLEDLEKDILNYLFYKKSYNEKESIIKFLTEMLKFQEFQTNRILEDFTKMLMNLNLDHHIKSQKL